MASLDPNVWLSLTRQFLAGLLAPTEDQAGYTVRVNAAGDNLEYVRLDESLQGAPLFIPTGVQVGDRWQYNDQITTTDTASHTILQQALPEGLICFRLFASGIAAGGYASHVRTETLWVTASSITSVDVIDDDSAGTLAGTFATPATSGNELLIKCTSNAGDGSTVWTATLDMWRHGA